MTEIETKYTTEIRLGFDITSVITMKELMQLVLVKVNCGAVQVNNMTS